MLKAKLKDLPITKLIFILCFLVFLVYANMLFNDFIWDDIFQVVDNSLIRNLTSIPLLFKGGTFEDGRELLEGVYYKPLMVFSFMINFLFWKGQVFGFHLFQLIVHLGNTILVFLILKALFEKEKIKEGKLIAFVTALIFGIHPGIAESVVYISATQDVLFTLFCLLALWLIIKKNRYALWLLGPLFFFSLLSKEAAITGGGVVLLYFLFFERNNLIKGLITLGLSFGAYLYLKIGIAQIPLFGYLPSSPIAEASLETRFLTMPWIFFSYLRIIFWPKVLATAQDFIVKEINFEFFWLPLIISLLFLVSLLTWGLKKGSKLFWFFVCWFLGSISLYLNLIPLDMTLAERWLYFPLIGLLGALSLLVIEIIKRNKKREKFVYWFLVVVLLLLGVRTVKRNSDWQNPIKLYRHDLIYSKNSYDLEVNLGVEYLMRGNLDEAMPHFERAKEVEPINWSIYNVLGFAWYQKGDLEKAENLLLQSIEIKPTWQGYKHLAQVYISQGKKEKAIMVLEEAIILFPRNDDLRIMLGELGE